MAVFEKALPENPTLLESLSPWKQIKNMKPIKDYSFTEIFGELHFKENNQVHSSSSYSPLPESSPCSSSSLSSSSFLADINQQSGVERLANDESPNSNERSNSPTSANYLSSSQKKQYKRSDSFSSMNWESLSLCTEGLGFESSDDVEDFGNKTSFEFQQPYEEKIWFTRQAQPENLCKESKRSRKSKGSFPPPISCIGRTGKPWVCFKSYRHDGRFILQEIRFPTQEFLHSCREDGRLKLQFIQSDDEILEGDEEEEEEDDDSDDIEDVNEEKVGDEYDELHLKDNNNKENDAEKNVQISTNQVQAQNR